MKNKILFTISIITLLLLNSCKQYFNPDKRSVLIIRTKTITQGDASVYGKYTYTINSTFSDEHIMYFSSDSDWNVGQELKFTLK